jgi:hypothetical protein
LIWLYQIFLLKAPAALRVMQSAPRVCGMQYSLVLIARSFAPSLINCMISYRAEDFSLFFFGGLVDYFQSVWEPYLACFQSGCAPIWSTFSLFYGISKQLLWFPKKGDPELRKSNKILWIFSQSFTFLCQCTGQYPPNNFILRGYIVPPLAYLPKWINILLFLELFRQFSLFFSQFIRL